jgi:chromosome segregation ATPase
LEVSDETVSDVDGCTYNECQIRGVCTRPTGCRAPAELLRSLLSTKDAQLTHTLAELARVQRERDEARAEVERLNSLLELSYAENERLRGHLHQDVLDWTALRARLAIVEPVYEAVKAWASCEPKTVDEVVLRADLFTAIDTALAGERHGGNG